MDKPEISQPAPGARPSARWAFALVAAMVLAPVAVVVGPDAGVLLIESGHAEAGKQVINLIGGKQSGLNAELFTQTYAGNAELTKYLLDHGAKADFDCIGQAIKKQRADILGILLDKNPSMAQGALIGGIINEEGTVEILETAQAHGAKVGFEALESAARGRPDLLPWVIAHGTFEPRDVMEAQKSAVTNGHLGSFERLRALAEPDEAAKGEILEVAIDKPGTLGQLLKTVSFGESSLRAGLAAALKTGSEESFALLKPRLPQATVAEVIRAAVAKQDPASQLLIREAANLPAPQTFSPAPR